MSDSAVEVSPWIFYLRRREAFCRGIYFRALSASALSRRGLGSCARTETLVQVLFPPMSQPPSPFRSRMRIVQVHLNLVGPCRAKCGHKLVEGRRLVQSFPGRLNVVIPTNKLYFFHYPRLRDVWYATFSLGVDCISFFFCHLESTIDALGSRRTNITSPYNGLKLFSNAGRVLSRVSQEVGTSW